MDDVEVRPSSGSKRVHAPRPLPPPAAAAPLHRQLLGAAPSQRQHCWDSLSRFAVQQEWDLYSPHLGGAVHFWPPFYLRRRTAVREVVAAAGLVVALADSGVCAAFDQESGELTCFVNAEADEVVRSLFVNRLNNTLITVSVFSGDAFQQLRVRATPLSALRAGRPHAWRPLFNSEVLRWPGFVEFDDVNDVAVTCSAETRTFKVYDLRTPHHCRFWVDSTDVRDMKIASGGVLLLTLVAERADTLPLRVLSLADGSCLTELSLPLEHSRGSGGHTCGTCSGSALGPLEVVELFGRHLLVKEAGGPLLIVDITADTVRRVPAEAFPSPAAFIHLPFNHTFLAFWQTGDAQLYSFEGTPLARLAHAALSTPLAVNTMFVTTHQDLMFVYCCPLGSSGTAGAHSATAGPAEAAAAAVAGDAGDVDGAPVERAGVASGSSGGGGGGSPPEGGNPVDGCIRVFELLRGRQVALVQPAPLHQQQQEHKACPPATARRCARLAGAAAAALKHLTAVFYDEHTHRLYTGTADGRMQAWAVD